MTAFLDRNDFLVQQIAWTLLHTLWQGVAIALLLAVVLRLMNRASSNARYLVACSAMTLLVVAAIVTFALLAQPPVAAAPRVARLPDATVPLTTPQVIAPHHPLELPQAHADPLRYIVTTWIAGVIAMAIWHIGGWFLLLRLRRGEPVTQLADVLARLAPRIGVRRAVRVLEAARVDVPAVLGVLRPVILVPVALLSDLSPQQVEAILAHELAHIRRHDFLINLIQSAIETLMFYHPATWWISMNIRRERENCCDDIATKICGDDRAYAAALAALENRRNSPVVSHLAPAATGGDLLDRVRRVLKLPPLRRRLSRTRSLAAAALALACVVLPLVVTAADEKPASSATAAATTPVKSAATDDAKPSPITPDDLKPSNEPYRLSKNDLVTVSIDGLVAPGATTVKSVRLGDAGKIALPNVADVTLAGLTVDEGRAAIVKAYSTILRDPQISLTLQESRSRVFSILGAIDRPGMYQITRDDLTALDALALSQGRLEKLGVIRVIRSADKRVLDVPPARLLAGDMNVNVVIRAGDMIITVPIEKKYHYVNVVVGKDAFEHDGKFIDIDALSKLLGAIAETERHDTVLAVKAASPDITVERFFTATAALQRLVDEHELAYLSQTGIQSRPTTAPATTRPAAAAAAAAAGVDAAGANAAIIPADADAKPVGEYYIDGIVRRSGVYSLSGRKITLKQAVAAAGGFDDGKTDALLTIVRRSGPNRESKPVENIRYSEIVSGAKRDAYLQANDVIQVRDAPPVAASAPTTTTTTTQPAAAAPAAAPAQPPDGTKLQQLLRQRQLYLLNLDAMSARLGPEHPTMKSARATLAKLDREIAEERAAIENMPVEQIASVDAIMLEYVKRLAEMEIDFDQTMRNLGPKHLRYLEAQRKIEFQKQRIEDYAKTWREHVAKQAPPPSATSSATTQR